jgi:hypothetical protein
MRKFLVVMVVASSLGGCAYKAQPIAAGSFDVVTSYSNKPCLSG